LVPVIPDYAVRRQFGAGERKSSISPMIGNRPSALALAVSAGAFKGNADTTMASN
jgi:hypothetical protein